MRIKIASCKNKRMNQFANSRAHPFRNAGTSHAGFTLIEILIVIGIIALLAGLLFPVFGRARENGKRTSCASNLKQIGLGMMLYVQDNGRRFPPAPTDADGAHGWSFALANRMKKQDAIFQCPSEPDKLNFTDYWINYDLQGFHEVRLHAPSSIIMSGDGDGHTVEYAIYTPATSPTPTGNSDVLQWDASADYAVRHLGGANYLFVDGHVKWLNPDQVNTSSAPGGSTFTLIVN